jgi:colanic acid/amylovoran biosynthesis protein
MDEELKSTSAGGYRVCILGCSLSTGNRGVGALAASLVELILEQRSDAHFYFFTGNRSCEPQVLLVGERRIRIEMLNYRLSPRARLREHLLWLLILALLSRLIPLPSLRCKLLRRNSRIAALLDADFVGDIQGGDSFSDIYGCTRLLFGIIPDLLVHLLGKQLIFLPQTLGPYRSPLAKILARFVIRRATIVLSRDRSRVGPIQDFLRVPRPAVQFCPDVAFLLHQKVPAMLGLIPAVTLFQCGSVVGLNINGLLYNGGYTQSNMFDLSFDYREFIRVLIAAIVTVLDVPVLLLPHTIGAPGSLNNDLEASRSALTALPQHVRERIHLLDHEYGPDELKGIIGLCSFFVGSRMHACIAALSQCIPTVAIGYSDKFHGVFDSVGVADMVIDARLCSIEDAVGRVLNGYRERDRVADLLKSRVSNVQQSIRRVFGGMMNSNKFSEFSPGGGSSV